MLNISKVQSSLVVTDDDGFNQLIYKDDLILDLLAENLNIKIGTGATIKNYPLRPYTEISISGVACVSRADFKNKLAVIVNFDF